MNQTPEPSSDSPCVGICQLQGDLCVGCGRLLAEIAGWSAADLEAREKIVQASRKRLAIITANDPLRDLP